MTLPILQEQPGALGSLMQGLGIGTQQAMPAIQELILNKQKQKQKEDLLKSIMPQTSDGMGQFDINDLLKMSQAGLDKEAALIAPFVLDQQKAQTKDTMEQRQKENVRQEMVPASKQLESMISSLSSQPGNREMSANLDTLGFWYTDKVYTHFNKGVINKEKFKNMKDELAPHSRLTPRENRARLKSLNTIMGLSPNISSKDFDKALDHEVKKVKKVSQTKDKSSMGQENQLTDEIAMQILQEAGGDANEARKIARDRGYVF